MEIAANKFEADSDGTNPNEWEVYRNDIEDGDLRKIGRKWWKYRCGEVDLESPAPTYTFPLTYMKNAKSDEIKPWYKPGVRGGVVDAPS